MADGDALAGPRLRTWRASHDWHEKRPLDAQGREPTWWQPGTPEQREAAREAEGVRFEQPQQLVPASEYNPWLRFVKARKKREKRLRQRGQREQARALEAARRERAAAGHRGAAFRALGRPSRRGWLVALCVLGALVGLCDGPPPAAQAPLEAMLGDADEAQFGESGPPAVKLQTTSSQTSTSRVYCGTWCAILQKEHCRSGTDRSASLDGARAAPYFGKPAPIDMAAKENMGGRLPEWGVVRALEYGADYVFACRKAEGGVAPVKEQATFNERWWKADSGRSGWPGKKLVGSGCSVTAREGPGLAVVLLASGWAKLLRGEHGGLDAPNTLKLADSQPQQVWVHPQTDLDALRIAGVAAKLRAEGETQGQLTKAVTSMRERHVVAGRWPSVEEEPQTPGRPAQQISIGDIRSAVKGYGWHSLTAVHTEVCNRHEALREKEEDDSEEPDTRGDALCIGLGKADKLQYYDSTTRRYDVRGGEPAPVLSSADPGASVLRTIPPGGSLRIKGGDDKVEGKPPRYLDDI